MNKDERTEAEATAILAEFRKGRISARLRDGLLRDLGYEVPEKPARDFFRNPGRNGRGGVQAKG
jgi:hypothetical protein